jgi:hypothetical protein
MPLLRYVTPLLALTLLLIPAPTANAQTSFYGSAALTDFAFFKGNDNTAKSDTGGLIGGAFYNFPIDSRLTAGIDGRVSYGIGSRGGTSVLAALRIGFVPDHVPLRPYFQVGGGVVSSTVNDNQITGPVAAGLTTQNTRFTSGAAEFAVGLDIRLTDSLDLCLPELGAAAPTSNASTTTVGTAFFDAGVVYHFKPHHKP